MKESVFAFILAENVRNQLRLLLHAWRAAAELRSDWLLGLFELRPVAPTRFGTPAFVDQSGFDPNRRPV